MSSIPDEGELYDLVPKHNRRTVLRPRLFISARLPTPMSKAQKTVLGSILGDVRCRDNFFRDIRGDT
jgi:hypothetical protein